MYLHDSCLSQCAYHYTAVADAVLMLVTFCNDAEIHGVNFLLNMTFSNHDL